jgi:hypothetical protein
MTGLSVFTMDDRKLSPIKRHAADALRRARKLPVGSARNDLRQLAVGLLGLEKKRFVTKVQTGDMALQRMKGLPDQPVAAPDKTNVPSGS